MRSPDRFCSGMEWDWGNPSLFGKTSGAFSASEVGNGSSRSSISVSVDSSSKIGGARVSGFSLEDFSKKVNNITELARSEDTGTSPIAAEFGEPLMGLRLGKRTYLEDDCAGNTVKGLSTTLVSAVPSTVAVKKTRASSQIGQSSHCQVEGCDIDLSGAKDYHRKHRVCLAHSKSPKVVVAGQERRFCQQCSRFHDLSEFDQKKRSCRRRLSDHNARRRKPQTDTISFNSSRPYSSFYDEQQMNFVLDRAPFGHGRPTSSSTWESSCGFSLTHTKGSSVKLAKSAVDGQLHFSNSPLSDTVAPLPHDLDKLLRFNGTTTELLSQGLEASVTSTADGAPDLQRALSLLSTGYLGSCNPTQTNLAKFVNSSHSSAAHPTVQAINPMSGFWHNEQPTSQQEARVLPLDLHSNGGQYQEFQLFKAPYETAFFDSSQILSKQDGQFLEFKA